MKSLHKILLSASLLLSVTLIAREPDWSNIKRPNVAPQGYKAAACAPANAVTQLDFNNIRARIENGGNMWMDRSKKVAAYEAPKGSNTKPLYAGALWMGGKSPNGQLKLAAVTFRDAGNDFWPGPLTTVDASTDETTCKDYNRFYHAFKADSKKQDAYFRASAAGTAAEEFPEGWVTPNYFSEWPAHGDGRQDYYLAPFYDFDQNGSYDPAQGDYPDYAFYQGPLDCRNQNRNVPLFGDTTLYWIFNDKGNSHTETGSEPIGMEIRAQAFAFADKSAINNMTFYNYVLINQGSQTLTETYFGQWADADLGNPQDDFVGCDVSRGLGYAYNGDNNDEDGQASGYGETPPAVGIDFFQGPYQDKDGLDNIGPWDTVLAVKGKKYPISYAEATAGKGIPYLGLGIGYGDTIIDNERFGMRKFVYYNISGTGAGPTQDPTAGQHYYNYLRGIWKDGSRFVYGGDAYATNVVSSSAFCDFMFPGDTDPLNFGTEGNSYGAWSEVSANNAPQDRRFMQSAGPFVLLPGQVNNITVGVVFARAAAGQTAEESVDELKKADDLAQGLFDNCFQIFEGPDAPDVTITELDGELILALTNPNTSNNKNEGYHQKRPEIPDAYYEYYDFEGYLIYQVKDATVGPADLNDDKKAKLIRQCDIINYELDSEGNPIKSRPIGILSNWSLDAKTNYADPQLEVDGKNTGIKRTLRVTEDLFASGSNKRLINNRPYYFIAVAYGYNNYLEFDPITFKGQSETFVASRKNGRGGTIQAASGIPHIIAPDNGGTILHSQYGDALPVTRYEGIGNGGLFTDITAETEESILANIEGTTAKLEYKPGFGPIDVRIYDPLKVKEGDFALKIIPDATKTTKKATWVIEDLNTHEKFTSERTINLGGEQLIVEKGFLVNVSQRAFYKEGQALKTDFIGAVAEFENPNAKWLTGIADEDGATSPANWILAGDAKDAPADNGVVADYNESYEGILGGTWAPYGLVSGEPFGPAPANSGESFLNHATHNPISNTTNVDIVFTPDKSKWTRCVVLEMSPDTSLAENGAKKGRLRSALSLDKNGNNILNGGNPDECNLVGEYGMSWFPGYAIDVESGERLNMAFSEDSWLNGEGGKDMIWNPTSRLYNPAYPTEFIGGGKHYIYVFKNTWALNNIKSTTPNNDRYIPKYDQCRIIYNNLSSNIPLRCGYVWRAGNWVGEPLLAQGFTLKPMKDGLVPSKLKIKLRVSKEYQPYAVGTDKILSDTAGSLNKFFPYYTFSTKGYAPEMGVTEVAKSALDIIRAVPNPYYAYASNFESDRLDNRIKITNLPSKCTLSIYTADGTLVRQFVKDDPSSFVEWDLKNFANIPISSGAYIIHINAPGIGEKVIKWFGVMRTLDLHSK